MLELAPRPPRAGKCQPTLKELSPDVLPDSNLISHRSAQPTQPWIQNAYKEPSSIQSKNCWEHIPAQWLGENPDATDYVESSKVRFRVLLGSPDDHIRSFARLTPSNMLTTILTGYKYVILYVLFIWYNILYITYYSHNITHVIYKIYYIIILIYDMI